MSALVKNCEMTVQKHRNQKEIDLEALFKKYNNMKRELEQAHNLERVKLQKVISKKSLAKAYTTGNGT